MSSSRTGRFTALTASIAAAAVLALPAAALAKTPVPRASTGAATHVLGTSALLTAVIQPAGQPTNYFFRYGLTEAYGSQTPSLPVPLPPPAPGSTTAKVKVGQAIGGLQPGQTYHYRVFAVNAAGAIVAQGNDHHFKAKGAALAFVVKKQQLATYGVPYILSGTLTGLGNGGHRIALQASPFPFLEPFTTIGVPGTTNAAGSFSFRVANLTSNTQFRVTTLDPLPVYSTVITVDVGVRVALHVRSSGQPGVVRLYGTVAPAVNGAKVSFQVQKSVRGRNETVTRWMSAFTTVAKKNGASSSRFSLVVTVRKGGRYRAYVKVPSGRVASGPSTTTVVLHAAPASALKHKKG
jgi:hypothetical protein